MEQKSGEEHEEQALRSEGDAVCATSCGPGRCGSRGDHVDVVSALVILVGHVAHILPHHFTLVVVEHDAAASCWVRVQHVHGGGAQP